MTSELLALSREKDKMYRKCIGRDKKCKSYIIIIKQRNMFSKMEKKIKQKYFADKLLEQNVRVRSPDRLTLFSPTDSGFYLPRRRRPGTGDIATPPVRIKGPWASVGPLSSCFIEVMHNEF